jgi:hypothetical protein
MAQSISFLPPTPDRGIDRALLADSVPRDGTNERG